MDAMVNNDDCIFKPIWNKISWVAKKIFLTFYPSNLPNLTENLNFHAKKKANWKKKKLKTVYVHRFFVSFLTKSGEN